MGYNVGKPIVTDGLILYLDPGNSRSVPGATNIYDISGNSVVGTAKSTPQILNNTFLLNGSSAYNLSDFTVSIGSAFTISAWIKFNNLAASNVIMQGGRTANNIDGEFHFSVSGTKLLFWDYDGSFGFSNQAGYSSSDIKLNQWYHITFVRNNLSGAYYLNSRPDGTKNSSLGVIYRNFGNAIFYDLRNNNAFLNASAGSLAVYNRALAQSEIQQNFEAFRGRYGI